MKRPGKKGACTVRTPGSCLHDVAQGRALRAAQERRGSSGPRAHRGQVLDHDTTKKKNADCLPIPEPLVPYPKHAIDVSPSAFVFPDAEGRMRTEEADPQKVLRRALARAGRVKGHVHVCRRCKNRGGENKERHPDAAPRRCPDCDAKLWPKALPRAMRFHDLRHTTATLLLRSRCPPNTSSASCGTRTSGRRSASTATGWSRICATRSPSSQRDRPKSPRAALARRSARSRPRVVVTDW